MKFIAFLIIFIYSFLSIAAFTIGIADSNNFYEFSACRKKMTYIGHYSGLYYIAKLGCRAGKPMEEEE